MKRSLFFLGLLLFGFFGLLLQPVLADEGGIGEPAPDFTLMDYDGNSHTLSSYSGKIIVLEWINHGCPFVKKHYNSGNMQSLQKAYTDKGAIWFSICSSAPGRQGYMTAEQANEITQQKEASPTAVLFDPEGTVGKLYNALTTPHMFIINKQGTLVYNGAIDDIRSTNVDDIAEAKNYVQCALDELLAGGTVSVETSQPYGCSVKYKK